MNLKPHATVVAPDGTCTIVYPANGTHFELEELQGFVGGYIELVRLSSDQEMYINENGKLDNLLVNPVATEKAKAVIDELDYICGPAVVGSANVFRSPEELEEMEMDCQCGLTPIQEEPCSD